jgi:hypothetical protein
MTGMRANQSKFFYALIALASLSACHSKMDEEQKSLDNSLFTLRCLNVMKKMTRTEIQSRVGSPCNMSVNCIRTYLDEWLEDCIKRAEMAREGTTHGNR